ncbi:dihydrofolate reductase [Hyphobacterium sp. CCMP332]|nr:dihydrofolate reductase [Hyphobacterium sp. CCMP332]
MLKYILIGLICISLFACEQKQENVTEEPEIKLNSFEYKADRFADIQILRYKVPGFDQLTLKQKKLVYYLSQAALSGRDIFYDQNYKHNIRFRKTIENIVKHYSRDRNSDLFQRFMIWAKRVWFSSGIHHHYAFNKFKPGFTAEEFARLIVDSQHPDFPTMPDENGQMYIDNMSKLLFEDEDNLIKKNQAVKDMVSGSAVNFYENVTQKEVEDYYASISKPGEKRPIAYGLNSKVVKEEGEVFEKKWMIGGMYSDALEKMVYWLDKAKDVAENETQAEGLELLIEYYKTGDLKTWDAYNVVWVSDTNSVVDYIHGFIEVYDDPLGYKGSYESVVAIKDFEMSKRMAALSKNAQYFEDNSSIMEVHKKDTVKGVSYRVINVVMEAGSAAPSTPIGINLPNSNWIRKEHGSKSVSLGNIKEAYEQMGSSLEEFAWDEAQLERGKKFGSVAGKMHTALHEVIGHASGQLEEGVLTPKETLKNYTSPLEEARADLVALYFIMDQKLVDLDLIPSLEVGKAQYDGYLRNGLMLQLRRIEPGQEIQQSHMRNRQAISKWVYERGAEENVVEIKLKEGKSFVVINDYEKLRELFGELLREIQRIKSQGDYEAGMAFIENYGVKVDENMHDEVLSRYEKLNMAPYSGFIQPRLEALMEGEEIIDVKISYPSDFVEQMLYYGEEYAFLPYYN